MAEELGKQMFVLTIIAVVAIVGIIGLTVSLTIGSNNLAAQAAASRSSMSPGGMACYDSDNGVNILVSGYVRIDNGIWPRTYKDVCYNNNKNLKEYYCENGWVAYSTTTCSCIEDSSGMARCGNPTGPLIPVPDPVRDTPTPTPRQAPGDYGELV